MDIPPPRLYVLDDEAPQAVLAVAFEKRFAIESTEREGTKANTAPPAALLVPEAHDEDEVAEFDCKKEQFLIRKVDETPIAWAKLLLLDGNDDAL